MRYYSYANGKLQSVSYELKQAIDSCYDGMGWVRDSNCAVVYSRADRVSSKTISEPFSAAQPMVMALNAGFDEDEITEDGYIIMNAQEIQLNRLLYYVSKGYPIMARLGEKEYCLIYGYTSDNIELFYPSENDNENSRRETMSIEDAAIMFDRYQDDYIVFKNYQGK